MTSINLDNLSQDNCDRLQQRAKNHGRSLESELDSILTSVFEPKPAEGIEIKEGFFFTIMPD